jgi:3-oxoacyl-[acyl-carrier protein] reductase
MTSKRTVLITGCHKGIGRAVLEALHATGRYTLYGIARQPLPAGLSSLTDELFICDLADTDALTKTMDKILAVSGGIDVLINNAGIGIFKPVDVLTLDDWNQVLTTNLTAPFLLTSHLLPAMKQKNYGRIISISSDAEHLSFADAGAYCAAKAGLKLLMDCVRKEADGYNIHVTTVAPGRVDTHFNNKSPGARPHSLQPEDVAAQVVFVLAQGDRAEVEQIYLNSAAEKLLH